MTENKKPKTKRALPPVARVIIGWKSKVKNPEAVPNFKPFTHLDSGKAHASVAEQKNAFLTQAKYLPYAGTLDDVFLLETMNKRVLQYTADPAKAPVAVRVANFLLKSFPGEWDNERFDNNKRPKVLFIGFGIKTFFRLLGAECTAPELPRRYPLNLWHNNPYCYDIGDVVMADSTLPLSYVLEQRRPSDLALARQWDTLTADWRGPNLSPQRDVYIACELASQVGLVTPAQTHEDA